MKKGLYVRVSTDDQAVHGFSLGAQKDSLIAFCKSQGWEDYEIYMDDGYSGTTLERPALSRLIRDIKNGRIDVVVVWRLDRLSRRQRHCLHLIEEVFEPNNVAFRSSTEPLDTSTPLGKAMIGILSAFAQLERDTIIERTREGHYKRARQGLWGGGPEPFGYRWNREIGKLEVVPGDAEIVRGIFDRVVRGHTLTSIADWAEAHSTTRRWWDHTVIKQMVMRDVYTGNVQYGTEFADGKHDAIIDRELAERVRKALQMRDVQKPIGQYLLSGLLRCGECGEPVVHHHVNRAGKNPTQYYVCTRKQSGKAYYKGGDPCTSKHFNMHMIDAKVVEKVQSIATDPSILLSQPTSTSSGTLARIEQYERELSSITRKLKRWYDLYEDEGINSKELKSHVRELEQEQNKIEMLLDDAKDELETPDLAPVLDAFHAIKDAWEDMEWDEKKSVLRATISKITVYRDMRLDIDWNLFSNR